MSINVLSLFDGCSGAQLALQRAGIKVDNYYASEVDKYAIQITQKNFPNTIQLGDINNYLFWELPKIDLIIGGSPCFASDTPVICKNKIVKIKNISVGDRVLTHKGRYQKVLKIGTNKDYIYKLYSQGATTTETTKDHPYFIRKRTKVWNNKKRKYEFVFSEPKWVNVQNIKKGDFVGTPILKTHKNPHNLTEDECFLLGLYIGDGHTRKDYRKSEKRYNDRHWQLIISVGAHEKDKFQKACSLKHSFYKHTKNVYRAVFSNKRMVLLSENYCGVGAKNKYLSKMLLDLPINLLKKVIEGYEFSDGNCRRNTYRATTISKKLVQTLSLAIAKTYKTTCCIEYTERSNKTTIDGRVVNQQNTYTISYRKKHPKKSRSWIIDNIVWNPVKNIVKTNKKETVYNIEVANDNSYIANNHIVHNCQGFSFAGKQLNFEDPRSKLFFMFVECLNLFKPKKFLLENVKMKKEYQDVISRTLGVEPININSNLVSAQNRNRFYWTNIKGVEEPEDRLIYLEDILEDLQDDMIGIKTREKSKCIRCWGRNSPFGAKQEWDSPYQIINKKGCLKNRIKKAGCLTAGAHSGGNHSDMDIIHTPLATRRYSVIECERLQTMPDNYTEGVSNTQRYKMIGNGFTIDVIAHILKQWTETI